MRPLEQYVTLRRGREALRQQADERRAHQIALLKKQYACFTRWLGIRLVIWGYKLQQVGALSDTSPL